MNKPRPEVGVILAARGRDAEVTAAILAEAGLQGQVIGSPSELVTALGGAGFGVIAEEALDVAARRLLVAYLDRQPPWSDIPLILITHRAVVDRAAEAERQSRALGNVTFLERPFHPTTLVSLARSALRARRRQYDARARMQELDDHRARLEERVAAALAERRVFAEIVESTDAFVQVSDMNYNLIAINRASANEFQSIYGVRPKVGDNMLEVLASQPEHREAVRALWSRALSGEEFSEIAAFGDPGRARRWYEMKYNVLRDARGRQIGAYQFVYDVTRRLEDQERLAAAEAHLRQAQKMEAVGQLTGGIAHDFNNILMVISGGLRMLDRRSDAASQAFIRDSLNQAVERGAALTRQLLAFSRKRPLEMKALSLARQFVAMEQMLNRALSGAITVELLVPETVWPVVTDAGELELAILNLCVNARDAMAEGGVIRITASNQNGGWGSIASDAVTVTVGDTGTGMSKEVLARVFEPFFTTKEIGKGSGLGLAQVYAFMKQSRGEVSISSIEGQGTTVTLAFPRSLEAAPAAAAQVLKSTPPIIRRDAGKLLLVEDDRSVAGLTIALLDSIGYQVEHVTSGADALAALANGKGFDVVFSDIMMAGGMSGADLARALRATRPALPVVLATGFIESGREIAAAGFRVLPKPYQLEELAKALATARGLENHTGDESNNAATAAKTGADG